MCVCVFKTMYYEICIATSWSSAMPALFSEAKPATWSLLHCCYQALLRWAGRRRRKSAPAISPLDIFDHKNSQDQNDIQMIKCDIFDIFDN